MGLNHYSGAIGNVGEKKYLSLRCLQSTYQGGRANYIYSPGNLKKPVGCLGGGEKGEEFKINGMYFFLSSPPPPVSLCDECRFMHLPLFRPQAPLPGTANILVFLARWHSVKEYFISSGQNSPKGFFFFYIKLLLPSSLPFLPRGILSDTIPFSSLIYSGNMDLRMKSHSCKTRFLYSHLHSPPPLFLERGGNTLFQFDELFTLHFP